MARALLRLNRLLSMLVCLIVADRRFTAAYSLYEPEDDDDDDDVNDDDIGKKLSLIFTHVCQ